MTTATTQIINFYFATMPTHRDEILIGKLLASGDVPRPLVGLLQASDVQAVVEPSHYGLCVDFINRSGLNRIIAVATK